MAVDAPAHLDIGRPVGLRSGESRGIIEGDRHVGTEGSSPRPEVASIGNVRRQVGRATVG